MITSIPMLAAATACIASVHDGDSIRLCSGERIRIANIDAPEMPASPKCQRGRSGWCDYRLAVQSRRDQTDDQRTQINLESFAPSFSLRLCANEK